MLLNVQAISDRLGIVALVQLDHPFIAKGGKLRIDDGKIKYFDHDYDAVVVAYPKGISREALDFVKKCASLTDKFISVGPVEYLNDGTACDYKFDGVERDLIEMGVKRNMTENSCTFEDGSVIFTTDGEQNLFNPLSVEFELEGHKIVFKGKDFLAFRLNGDKPEFVFGECDVLTLDGESLI